jgi:hypothetical protein
MIAGTVADKFVAVFVAGILLPNVVAEAVAVSVAVLVAGFNGCYIKERRLLVGTVTVVGTVKS